MLRRARSGSRREGLTVGVDGVSADCGAVVLEPLRGHMLSIGRGIGTGQRLTIFRAVGAGGHAGDVLRASPVR